MYIPARPLCRRITVIIRAPRPEKNYMLARNDVVRDGRLSYRASGVLGEILSRPDNWRIDAVAMSRSGPGREGIVAIRAALRELEACGYLVRRRVRTDTGKFMWEHTVYDTPQASDVLAGQTTSRFPSDGSPQVDTCSSKEQLSTNNLDEDEQNRVGDVPPPSEIPASSNDEETRPAPTIPRSHRAQDQATWIDILGCTTLTSNGPRWEKGTWRVDVWYGVFRRELKIRWPGMYLAHSAALGEVDDYLASYGLTRPNGSATDTPGRDLALFAKHYDGEHVDSAYQQMRDEGMRWPGAFLASRRDQYEVDGYLSSHVADAPYEDACA